MTNPPAPNPRKCGAKLGPDRTCQAWAMPNGKCRIHGGLSPAPGVSHPRYSHGRYSKSMPTRLRAGYERALEDPDLLNRTEDLGLISARLNELLERLEQGGGIERDKKLKALVADYRNAGKLPPDKRVPAQAFAINELISLIDRTAGDEVWEEVGDWLDRYNRMADGERKRLQALHATITADQAMVMIDALSQIVLEEVIDPGARARIGNKFGQFIGRVTGGSLPAADGSRSLSPAV